MRQPIEVIEYEPFRGQVEPVTNVTIAKVSLFKDHIEIRCFYEFQEYYDPDNINVEKRYRENFVKCHLLLKRDGLEICRSVRIHPDDTRSEECPIIEMWSKTGLKFNALCKNDDADKLMRSLRNWILG